MARNKRPPFVQDEPCEGDKEFAIHGPGRLELRVYYDDLSEREARQVQRDTAKMLRLLNTHWDDKQ